MRKIESKIGDVFEIPLSDGRKTYGQYVDDNGGNIIRIFNYSTSHNERPDLSRIDKSDLLFPPIHTSIDFAIKNCGWKIVGKLSIDGYVYKGFLNHSEVLPMPKDRRDPIRIKSWALWDGKKWIELGERLSEKYQKYESGAIFPPDLIVKRIETGFNMFEYPKKHNRFLTKEEVEKKLKAN